MESSLYVEQRYRAGIVVVALVFPVLLCPPASAECPGDFLVSPSAPGADGGAFLENFHTLVDDLYMSDAVRTVEIGGDAHLAPPWFRDSTKCGGGDLHTGDGIVPSPSFDDYLLNGDELSELALVIALSTHPERMAELDRTVQVMSSAAYDWPGMPCWLARVQTSPAPSITCVREDTATDITVRIGLAYYFAAANPHFPQADRDIYLARANELASASKHLMLEYANEQPFHSGVTWNLISDWIGGGAETAKVMDTMEMWIGYHQDAALFLLAAYHATTDPLYLARAEDVVDQWLMANRYAPPDLSFGCMRFRWDTSQNPLQPVDLWEPCMQGDLVWDDSDAPRALWMGHVLRAYELATDGAAPSLPFQHLADWIELLLATGTQTSTTSCIQYNRDGTVVSGNCGTDYYYNGLGAGLVTWVRPSWLKPKLDVILPQYGWSATKTWNSASCFGIYRGIRPLKALAAALGLDAAAYGGSRPGVCTRLDVTVAGDGFVTSPDGGVDCAPDCLELYPEGEAVALEAVPYQGASFDAWSGPDCADGMVTMSQARICAATFQGTCNPTVNLSNQTVQTTVTFAGCQEISAGDGFLVEATGDVTFRAGTRVVLRDGFRVATDGRFTALASAGP